MVLVFFRRQSDSSYSHYEWVVEPTLCWNW